MSSVRQQDEIRAAITRNARARDREQLRNQVLAEHPGLTSDEVEQRVEQIYFERRSAGGRTSAARRQEREARVAAILAHHDRAITLMESALDELRRCAIVGDAA